MVFRANKLRIWRDLSNNPAISLGSMGLFAWFFFGEKEIEGVDQIPISSSETAEDVAEYFAELLKEGYLSHE